MCGRVTLSTPADIIAALYDIELGEMPEALPRYNIAPTQPLITVRNDGDGNRASTYTWGFLANKKLTINARQETVARLPLFRDAFARRRCVVPADGFYEWQTLGKRKQPFHFHKQDGSLFSIAALWTPAADPRETPRVVLLTTAARGEIASIHDRMPVIVPRMNLAEWLSPDSRHTQLFSLLHGSDAEVFGTSVNPAVNNAAYDSPDCLKPAPTFLI